MGISSLCGPVQIGSSTKSTKIRSPAHQALQSELVAARHRAELTQQALADMLKRPQSFVAKYEGGERRLDVVELLEILRLCGADPHQFIDVVAAQMGA